MADAVHHQRNLSGFENLSALPEWLPGETIFSLASRYHALSGNRLPSETCTTLFGHPRQGCQHDFPTRLNEFSRRARLSECAQDLALRHTPLPFYLPLRSEAESEAAVQALATPHPGVLKFRLGILTSRFRANHPLKACPQCIADEVRSHGTGYWHVEHQLPGVWFCRQHGVALKLSRLKSTGVARFGWLLPTSNHLDDFAEPTGQTMTNDALSRFADLASRWSSQPFETHLPADRLAHIYRGALGPQDWQLSLSSREMSSFAPDFCAAVAPLRHVPELSALPATAQQASALLDRCIRRPRGGTHPLNHLAIIYWLFSSWDAFSTRHLKESAPVPLPAAAAREVQAPQVPFDSRPAILSNLLAKGHSITAAARQVGVDTHTAVAWAASAGIGTPRRPKTLKGNVFDDLVAVLRNGTDKADAALLFSVSVHTVTRVLRSVVGLQATWHAARAASAREKARTAWLAAVARKPGAGVKAVRDMAPGAYAWLYRNDREWLREASKRAAYTRVVMTAPRVDWDARDRVLSADVRRVSAELAEKSRKSKLALWEIYQALPELKAKLGALDRLPLTRRALSEATRRRI